MNLFLIRHAESKNNICQSYQERVSDPELTENGHLQSTYLAEFLQKGLHLSPREFEENQKNISDINEMLGKGQIKPLISKEIPMENAVEAIKLIGSRGVVGKVVLVN